MAENAKNPVTLLRESLEHVRVVEEAMARGVLTEAEKQELAPLLDEARERVEILRRLLYYGERQEEGR
jgi:hypothetical protein